MCCAMRISFHNSLNPHQFWGGGWVTALDYFFINDEETKAQKVNHIALRTQLISGRYVKPDLTNVRILPFKFHAVDYLDNYSKLKKN